MEETPISERKVIILSQGGNGILLKAMALAIPMHTMSCFMLSLSPFPKLESLMANFLWGQWEDEQEIHWISLKNNVYS